jgi:hypothetical protein
LLSAFGIPTLDAKNASRMGHPTAADFAALTARLEAAPFQTERQSEFFGSLLGIRSFRVRGCGGGLQIFEGVARLEALGKCPFVVHESGADLVMREGRSEGSHLVHGFVGGPAFIGHAIGRHGHSCAIIAQAAMDENFFSLFS